MSFYIITLTDYVLDDQFSKVDGIFTNDGLFDGHIQTRDTLFYVEPAKRQEVWRGWGLDV